MHDDVVEVGLQGGRLTRRGVLVDAQLLHLPVDVEATDGGIGRAQIQAQHLGPAGDAVHLGDVQLVVADLAALDGVEGLGDGSLDGDVALEGDGTNPLDHLLADGLAVGGGGDDALDAPVGQLAQLDKAHLGALHTGVLDPGAQLDRLAEDSLAVVLQGDLVGAQDDGVAVAVVILGLVLAVALGLCGGQPGLMLGGALGLLCFLLGFGLGLLESLLRRSLFAIGTFCALCGGGVLGRRDGLLFVGHSGQ